MLSAVLALTFATIAHARDVDWKAGALGHLSPFIGTYGVTDILDDPMVKASLDHLLPAEARALIPRNLQVAGPVDFISGWLVLSGNAPHAGGEDEAQVWLKVHDGAAIVVLTQGGERTLYSDLQRYSHLPKVLRAQLALAPEDMLSERPPALTWYGKE